MDRLATCMDALRVKSMFARCCIGSRSFRPPGEHGGAVCNSCLLLLVLRSPQAVGRRISLLLAHVAAHEPACSPSATSLDVEEPIFARLGCCAPQVADPLLRRHFSSLHSEAVAFDHGFKLFFQRRRRRHHRQTMFVRRNETHEFHHALDGNGTGIKDGCLH